ncbi:FkbM family methyltransferase [Aurantimonas sp. A2-1-M11]|uniref:FkbM family methyltransferase n=1 Tax=Aurantimonas sp. A2-1-M11 TaxID=3113712 RepID=UPI002F92A1D5
MLFRKRVAGSLNTLRYVFDHPINRDNRFRALWRLGQWQCRSRLTSSEIVFDWVGDSKLAVRKGMYGATGNIYCGIHEFSEMGFILHFLRPDDLFCDIGANIGSYTILASKVTSAKTYSFEPDPVSAAHLATNVTLNGVNDLVQVHQIALGAESGHARFTIGQGPVNKITSDARISTREVPVRSLDSVLDGRCPTAMKIDVEGYEENVLRGATRTLENPILQAITIETMTPWLETTVAAAGFRKIYYDPRTRRLSEVRPDFAIHNTLLIRDQAMVKDRLVTAPPFSIFGRHF